LAERHFSQAVALKNDFTDSRNNLVSTYIEEGKYDLALEEGKKVASDLNERPLIEDETVPLFYLHHQKKSHTM
jgi:lipoprotein NlpI